MTQAPTPGPLNSESVKLLVKGDLTLCADRIIRAVEQADVERGVVWFTDGEASGPCVLSFIGRPDADDWMPWSGGENPVPGHEVEGMNVGGTIGIAPAEFHDWPNIIAFRLAPTAPVEASGSEREVVGRVRQMIVDCEADPDGPLMLAASVAAEHASDLRTLLNLRPQPSGETREALDRLKMAAHVYEDDEMAADCATLEALLSARPLALGGQS